MTQNTQIFHTSQSSEKLVTWGDVLTVVLVVALLYAGIHMAIDTPKVIEGPDISLAPSALPAYALLSVGRMAAAYLFSLVFSLVYGRTAAYHRRVEKLMIPLLDVLQSVPILSFLPVVLLSFSSIMPENTAAELASIVLIFTSQAWNITFGWYQSMNTLPKELKEASAVYHLNSWFRFKYFELPFGMIGLIWNSMMSWAGGWFFLMAAETFTVGSRDFRLPGLGSYLQEAARQSDYRAIAWGVGILILVVVLLDQLVWRPLIAWSDRFKVEMIENDNPPTSWFYDLMSKAHLTKFLSEKVNHPLGEAFERFTLKRSPAKTLGPIEKKTRKWPLILVSAVLVLLIGYGFILAVKMLITVPSVEWGKIGLGVLSTFLRVAAALALALLWTVPVGVLIGTNRKLSKILQPIVQITAAVPATALFPVLLLFILNLQGGLNLAAVILMLMGTQWYLLFNVIAGASAIPQDLIYTSKLMHLSGWQRWRTLILPAIFPYLVTGAITASGGAWNASIVAEYQNFGGRVLSATGIGSLIAQATSAGNYSLLLASTLSMILTVIVINRLVWRRLLNLAEEKYRME